MRKALLALPVALAIASCDDVYVHILTGQQYDPVNQCVQAPAGIDVVSGGATGDNCDPTCLVATAGDASFVYVTTTCPPYPQGSGAYTVEGQDATTGPSDPCTGAFAAYGAYLADGATCPATVACDGGDAGDDGSGCTTAEAGDDGGGTAGDDGGGSDAPTE
jgi:hypothetical protein